MKSIQHHFIATTLFIFATATLHAQCDSACTNPGTNLLVNSDFELGNTGFGSAYNFATGAASGNYGITTNTGLSVASQWCNQYDHTSGSGNYMWIDGASTVQTIWSQAVSVSPGVDYNFSFWGMNLSIPYSGGTMEFVDVYINGILIQSGLELNSADCFWIQHCVQWNAGIETTAVIELKNTNTHFMGNDLAFDDFSFKSCNQPINCNNPGANMVLNPDFEAGNVDFTTDYLFSSFAGQGYYGISQNTGMYVASQWCNQFDHTSGSGNYLWIDGATVPLTIWRQTFSVIPNTDYGFSFWGMNLSIPYSGGTMEFVDVFINGGLVASALDLNTADCIWQQKFAFWNSGAATSATVEIRNTNSHFMGNDLAFDDISFTSCNASVNVCGATCTNPGSNLLSNPGFESGNTGFTSSHNYSTAAGQGNYGITTNTGLTVASQWCNSNDHTSGSGNYLWIDGAAVSQTMWSQTVTVVPYTDYSFSFWGMNLSVPYSGGTMEFVDVYINGNLVAANLDLNTADCEWMQYCASWNAGSANTATIELRNSNTHFMGNDLAFDDLVFMSCGNALSVNTYSEQLELLIYPNPANDVITIEGLNSTNMIVNVFDLTGKTVMQNIIVPGTLKLDVSMLTAGTYLIKTNADKGNKTHKIQIIK